MYRIKDNINLEELRRYGFKLGKEYEDTKFICDEDDYEDYWLISMRLDDIDKILYSDEDDKQPVWNIRINTKNRKLYIDSYTYHIDNMDMEHMFFVLKNMIEDGIVEDDYEPELCVCTWCYESFTPDEGKIEKNLGFLCHRCIAGIESRGETLTFK